MSIFTTLTISRKVADEKFYNLCAHMSNSELEDYLFDLFSAKTLYNFSVVDSECEADDEYFRNSIR